MKELTLNTDSGKTITAQVPSTPEEWEQLRLKRNAEAGRKRRELWFKNGEKKQQENELCKPNNDPDIR